jgi:hypothetical protein
MQSQLAACLLLCLVQAAGGFSVSAARGPVRMAGAARGVGGAPQLPPSAERSRSRCSSALRRARMVGEAGIDLSVKVDEFATASFDTSIGEIPKCPETRWDYAGFDSAKVEQPTRSLPATVRYDASSGLSESAWVAEQKDKLLEQLTEVGALWFRGFESMKTKDGFQVLKPLYDSSHQRRKLTSRPRSVRAHWQAFYEMLELEPCQDPLASVGARAVVSKKGAMYEAVNKPSRAKFFVGMHNESTFKRTNRLGAFVCFKQAATGGEFLLLDGQKILAEMDPEVLHLAPDPLGPPTAPARLSPPPTPSHPRSFTRATGTPPRLRGWRPLLQR